MRDDDDGSDIWIHRYGLKPRGRDAWNGKTPSRVLEGFLVRRGDGYGCVQPWPELGDATLHEQFQSLMAARETPLLARVLACAEADGRARREGRSLWDTAGEPPLSHATVTGENADFSALQAEGFRTVKLKGSGGPWRGVLDQAARAQAAGLRVRVDFNGCLTPESFVDFARAARTEGVEFDFIEDPVPPDEAVWKDLRRRTGLRLAADRGSLTAGFDVKVVKPALEGAPAPGGPPVVFTSYMDHPLGQVFAAWEAARYSGGQLEAGLLTHRLFAPDAFTERLGARGPRLALPDGRGLGFDDLLAALPWEKIRGSPVPPRGLGRVLQNPRAPLPVAAPAMDADHVGFLTSGSTGAPSVVAHTAASLEASARAVNAWLGVRAQDVWLRALPDFHVGGYQISTRARLAGARVVEFPDRWDAERFADIMESEGATLASLVPAQIFDLVKAGLRAPARARAVLAGGGAMDADLAARAGALGWRVFAGYGMTEAASTIAAAAAGEVALEFLPDWRARIVEPDAAGAGLLELAGPALCAGRHERAGDAWVWRPAGDWWRTSDLARLSSGSRLELLGRADRVVKILGELVSLDAVERGLEAAGLAPGSFAVEALPDARTGSRLILAAPSPDLAAVERYQASAAPFARLRELIPLDPPRTALGKIRRAALRETLLTRRPAIPE